MKIAEDIKPVTYLKRQASELLRTLDETRRPMVITQSGQPKAVMLDVESYQRMQDGLQMLRLVAHSEQAIDDGRTIPQDEVFSSLRRRLEDG